MQFRLGNHRSLGLIGLVGLVVLAIQKEALTTWTGVVAVFIGMNCWNGLQHARALARVERLPRHQGFNCPSCRAAPPIGAFWRCGACSTPFDSFETHAGCPYCGAQFTVTRCPDCGAASPIADWAQATPRS